MAEEADAPPEDIDTLEPLVDAVREGVEGRGWKLSGLQKTTSYRFEGRWEGDSTRSAYLFFHRPDAPEDVSIDVYLDETSRGLKGNLALVMDVPPPGMLGSVQGAMGRLGRAGSEIIPGEYRRPLTLRFRLTDVAGDPAGAGTEVRYKVHIPAAAVAAGRAAVVAVAESAVDAFEELLSSSDVRRIRGETEGCEATAPDQDAQ